MARRRTPPRTRPLALGYVRVSTADQAEHGASLDAQRAALQAEADRRGFDLELVIDEGLSGKDMRRRPQLLAALDRLDRHEADVLLVTRLDRLSRSVRDFADVLDRSKRRGWRLVMLSPDLDTADPAGRFSAYTLAAAAEFERELIGARTREGLAQRKAEGVVLGRPRTIPEDVAARIRAEHEDGRSLRAIAQGLTDDGVPTARGRAEWSHATVQAVLRREPAPA